MENIKAGTTYTINPTIDEIVRECDGAWERARELRIQYGLIKGVVATEAVPSAPSTSKLTEETAKEEDVYMELAHEHMELNKTYPVILATMAGGSYDSRAVLKFFKYVKEHPWRSEAEFLDIQSVYGAILYRLKHKHSGQKDTARMRNQVRSALTENERATKEQVERAKQEATENNKRHAKGRLIDMLARVPRDSAILTRAEVRPIIVTFDGDL
jgi:hypothetical protein